MVTKRIVTALVVVMLAGVATWLTWWPPLAWSAAKARSDDIALLTDLATWALWIAAVVTLPVRWWLSRKPDSPAPTASITNARAGHDQIAAGGDVQTGGIHLGGEGEALVGGDVVARDKIVVQQAAAAAPASALHQLPAPPRDFTGREEELRELLQGVREGGCTISGVRGMGGIGKTALALKLAQELAPEYPDAQFFLELKGTSPQPLTSADAMAHVIRGFYPEARVPDSEAELSGLYHTCLHGKRVLLLMDNAAGAGQVAPLIPPAGCVLLVTSRQHFTLPGLHSKNLETLPPEDARELLLGIAPHIGEHADEIARLCGYLPLALCNAGSLLQVTADLDPQQYAVELHDERRRLERIGKEGVDPDVEASFNLSYVRLSEDAARVFRELAAFPGSFDAAAAEAVCDDEGHVCLSDLVKRSLVGWDNDSRRYRLHDLARLFADSRLSDDERAAAQRRHAEHYKAVLAAADDLYLQGGEETLRGLALFDAERQNIQAGQEWAAAHAGEDQEADQLCSAYGSAGAYVLSLRLPPRERITWLEAALAAARRLKGREAEGVHLTNLGPAYADLGEPRRAIEFFEQALEIDRETGDRRGEGADLGNLGNAYLTLGDARRAIEFHEQALVISRELGDRRSEGSTLGNLGNAYLTLGDARRAIEYYDQRLEIAREIGDRWGEGNALGNLGLAYADMGETRRAMEFYEQALAIHREIGDRRGEGAVLGNLGTAYRQLGETRRAIEHHEQALAIAREIGDRRGEASDLWNMALPLDELGERNKAIANAEAALEIFEQIEDPAAARVRAKLAEWRRDIAEGDCAT